MTITYKRLYGILTPDLPAMKARRVLDELRELGLNIPHPITPEPTGDCIVVDANDLTWRRQDYDDEPRRWYLVGSGDTFDAWPDLERPLVVYLPVANSIQPPVQAEEPEPAVEAIETNDEPEAETEPEPEPDDSDDVSEEARRKVQEMHEAGFALHPRYMAKSTVYRITSGTTKRIYAPQRHAIDKAYAEFTAQQAEAPAEEEPQTAPITLSEIEADPMLARIIKLYNAGNDLAAIVNRLGVTRYVIAEVLRQCDREDIWTELKSDAA